jgi:hypothetical protein
VKRGDRIMAEKPDEGAMAKKFFKITMIGTVVYCAAVYAYAMQGG